MWDVQFMSYSNIRTDNIYHDHDYLCVMRTKIKPCR
jgi:hypothetical protein